MKNENEEIKSAELPQAIHDEISNRDLPETDEEKKRTVLLAAKNNLSAAAEIINVLPTQKPRTFYISPVWMYAAALLIFFALTALVKQNFTEKNTQVTQQKRMTKAERIELAKMLLIDNRLDQTRRRTVAMRSRDNEFFSAQYLDTKLTKTRSRSNRLNKNSQIKDFPTKKLKQKSLKLNYHNQPAEQDAQEA